VKRLTPASLTFGVMAIMGLLVAAYVVRTLMAREQKVPAISTRNMPTPVVDLPIGTEITEKHLGNAPIRTDELTSDMLANRNIIIGRVVREPLKKAQPIRANQLYAPGERPQLAMEKGKQALTLPFDGVTTIVDGLIRPGDHCDVRFTLNPAWIRSDLRTSQAFQMTLFKALKVIAINRNTVQQQPDHTTNTVTLEVSPKQANALLLAKSYGAMNLTYTEDLTPGGVVIADADADRLTLEQLLGLPMKVEPAAPPKPPEPYRVDVYRGLSRNEMQFHSNGRIIEGNYSINGWGNGANTVDPNVVPTVPAPGNLDLNFNPGTRPGSAPGLPAPPGLDINSARSNGPRKTTANGNPVASNNGNSGSPRQAASNFRFGDASSNGFTGPGQQNSPQFYGQSAPGQTTGPGYTVAPGFSPGIYGNAPYYRAQ